MITSNNIRNDILGLSESVGHQLRTHTFSLTGKDKKMKKQGK